VLGELLDEEAGLPLHPFIIGVLVMGGLSRQEETYFQRLPQAPVLPHAEVLEMVRRRHLVRRGVGWIDAHLLASALASSSLLWSADRALAAAAVDLHVRFDPTA
jgi:hypothetical protein